MKSEHETSHGRHAPFTRSMVQLPKFLCGNLHVECVEISIDFSDLPAGERSMLN